MDASERRQARATAVRIAVARWPSCWLAIRRRYQARVTELEAEGIGFGLTPAEARVDAVLLAYVEVTRQAEAAGICIPSLAPPEALEAAA